MQSLVQLPDAAPGSIEQIKTHFFVIFFYVMSVMVKR